MLAENHGILFGIDIAPYIVNQPLKLFLIQRQMGGAYAMVQHTGMNVVPELQMSIILFLYHSDSFV